MWLGTLNNPPPMPQDYIEAWVTKAGAVYATGQLEKGKEGTPHIQFFVQFKQQKRLGHLKTHCPAAHFERVKANNGADEYCNKEDTRVEGPWTFGVRPARLNKKGDLKRRNQDIIAMGVVKAVQEGIIPIEKFKQVKQSVDLFTIMTTKHTDLDTLQGEWHVGKTGTGKSRTVRTAYPDAFIKSNDTWWDGYANEETVIIEELGPNQIGAQHMKLWADRYQFKANQKGSQILIRPARICVTSNYTIREIWTDSRDYEPLERRFTVHTHTRPFN